MWSPLQGTRPYPGVQKCLVEADVKKLGGSDGWRLPTLEEAAYLVTVHKFNQSLIHRAPNSFWTSDYCGVMYDLTDFTIFDNEHWVINVTDQELFLASTNGSRAERGIDYEGIPYHGAVMVRNVERPRSKV